MKNLFLIFALFLVTFHHALGQSADKLKTEQPLQEVFQTELVYPQEKGEFQLTFAPRFSRKDAERTVETPVRLEYGITNRWQIEVEFNSYSRRRPAESVNAETGAGDVAVSTKYSFLNVKNSNYHSSVQFEIGFPTGNVDKGLSEGFVEYQSSANFARDFPKLNRLQIFSQIGVNFKQRVVMPREPEENESAAPEFIINGGFFAPYKKARFVGEINYKTNRRSGGGNETEVYLTPGFVYKLPGRWEIGIGAPIGISRDADNFRFVAQAVFEF